MEHEHRMIITCEHVFATSIPEMLWIQSGEVQAALCLACAHGANEAKADEEPPDAMKPICAECARIENIPVTAKMPDGFYEWHEGRWERQPQVEDAVN